MISELTIHDTIVKGVNTLLLYSYLCRYYNSILLSYIALKDFLMLTHQGT